MTRRLPLLLLLVTSIAGVLLFASPASAHNSLATSDPADGTTVAVAPTQLSLVFATSVPLDTLSIEAIDATGVRTDLTGSFHGPNGDTEVITPLPVLPVGDVNLRWRLVGPDGHPITGRVGFAIAVAPGVAAPGVAAAPAPSTSLAVQVAAPVAVPAIAPAALAARDIVGDRY